MTDILSRLSALTGPSREMDDWIAIQIGAVPKGMECCDDGWWGGGGKQWHTPRYTQSIDAALTLMPEGCGFMLRYYMTASGMRACCSLLGCSDGIGDTWDVWGITPAIALVIACLKAKEASKP